MNEILKGNLFELAGAGSRKFKITKLNFNDFGFHTRYNLEEIIPEEPYPLRIASLRIANPNQEIGKLPTLGDCTPSVWIDDISSAEELLLILSPEARRNLQSLLDIKFDANRMEETPVFRVSVLRDRNINKFHEDQLRIKYLIQIQEDISSMILSHKTHLNWVLHGGMDSDKPDVY